MNEERSSLYRQHCNSARQKVLLPKVKDKKVSRLVQFASYLGLVVVVLFDYYYPFKATIYGREVYLSQYLIFIVLLSFGVWRIFTEENVYQKVRISAICFFYLLFWSPIPSLFGIKAPLLNDIHTVGTVLFFLYFMPVVLIGKRADCGWNCICVTIRETLGYAFRDKTLKGSTWWKLQNLKWLFFGWLVMYLGYMFIDQENSYNVAGKQFYNVMTHTYYFSFLLLPLMGNRNFCRFLCPYSALWGVLSKVGFYKIKANTEKCINCRLCEQQCDMGIPINRLVTEKGEINSVECMGCGRCVNVCPQDVLSIYDVRDALFKGGKLHLSAALKKKKLS